MNIPCFRPPLICVFRPDLAETFLRAAGPVPNRPGFEGIKVRRDLDAENQGNGHAKGLLTTQGKNKQKTTWNSTCIQLRFQNVLFCSNRERLERVPKAGSTAAIESATQRRKHLAETSRCGRRIYRKVRPAWILQEKPKHQSRLLRSPLQMGS